MEAMKNSIRLLKSDYSRSIRGFSLEYLAVSGRHFGPVPENETRLIIQEREASLFRRKGPGDSHQVPPGRYSGQISDTSLFAFLDALQSIESHDLPTEAPGPRDPKFSLSILIGGRFFSLSWGVAKKPGSVAWGHLKRLLTEWTMQACPMALWSLSMTIETLALRGKELASRLLLENQGSQVIRIAHPASPGLGSEFGLFLKYGERPMISEDITPSPMVAKRAPLQTTLLEVPEFLDLEPGKPFPIEFRTTLEDLAPRGWIGRFGFQHHLPQDTVAGVPVFSGALFTEEREW